MQALLTSLVVAMTVKDEAAKASFGAIRSEAKKTGQEVETSGNAIIDTMTNIQRHMIDAAAAIVRGLEDAEKKVRNTGIGLVAAVTVPLGLMQNSARASAADFEQAMLRVRSALLAADPAQIEALGKAAMTLGPAAGKSASEAAAAIETLAKNGLNAAQILGGALEETLKLSVIGFADTGEAADLTTDIMAQFNKDAKDLAPVVDRVTGALDVSKLSFDDYRLAIGQTGGVAGGLGYSFEDMNVAIAASASLFASGSDAGTSFKTFLLALKPQSDEAAFAMKKLGLEFFDSTGKAKPLTEIAALLNEKLSKLSDRSKTDALTKIFGSDAMRTALALMNQGADGLERIRKQIDAVTAQQKLEIVRDGDVQATIDLANAWNQLSIKFGSVLLPVVTAVKNAVAGLVSAVAGAPQWFFNLATGVSLAAAALGPLLLVTLAVAKVALPLLLLRLGPLAIGFAAVINPVGVLIRLLGQLALMAGAQTLLGTIGTRLVGLAGPLGIVITLLAVFVPLLFKTREASESVVKINGALTVGLDAYTQAAQNALTATDANRESALKEAAAKREQARQTMASARAKLADAAATLAQRRAEFAGQQEASRFASMSVGGAGTVALMKGQADDRVRQAQFDYNTQKTAIDAAQKAFDSADGILKAAAALPGSGKLDINLDKPGRTRKGRAASDRTEQNRERYLGEMADLEDEGLRQQQDLTADIRERARIEHERIDHAQEAYEREIASRVLQNELTKEQASALIAEKKAVTARQHTIVNWQLDDELTEQDLDLARSRLQLSQDEQRRELDAARTQADRRRIQLEILRLEQLEARAAAEAVLAKHDSTEVERQKAQEKLNQLDGERDQRTAAINRDTMGPWAQWLDSLPRTAEELREKFESIKVDALNNGLDVAASRVVKLKGLAGDLFNQLINDVIRLNLQSLFSGNGLLGSLAKSLGLGGGSSGDGLAALGAGLGDMSGSSSFLPFGGARANGGAVSPGSWYMVGERGPEPFIPHTAGTIMPNESLRRGGAGGPIEIHLIGEEGAAFVPRVAAISGEVSGETVKVVQTTAARRSRWGLSK